MSLQYKEKHLYTDVLVIGGGMSGLFSAIKARHKGVDVILVDNGFVGRSGGSHYAEGDIQFYRPKRGHTKEVWLDVANKRNEYVNNPEWWNIVLDEIEERYNYLVSWGIEFYEKDGELVIAGPHTMNGGPVRTEFISMRCKQFSPSLRAKAMEFGVRVYDRIMTCELLKQDDRITGAVGFYTTTGDVYVIHAGATVMATGTGTCYKAVGQNTDYWTGDGECMAYCAGAEIAGKEFTWSNSPPSRQMIDERKKIYTGGGVKGKNQDVTHKYPYVTIQSGWLWPILNAEGTPAEYGPWDVHCGKGPLYYDCDPEQGFTPRLEQYLRDYFERIDSDEPDKIGLDFFNGGKIEYSSARYRVGSVMGGSGIWPVNKQCESQLPGLFAAGGSCATMISGASYGGMGSGLSTAMVTGTRAGEAAAAYAQANPPLEIGEDVLKSALDTVMGPLARQGGFTPEWLTRVLQGTVVPYYLLAVKKEDRMLAALTNVRFLQQQIVPRLRASDPHELRMAHEAKNMVLNAEMQLVASLFRKESRGTHFREDYPRRNDPEWLAWTLLKGTSEDMEVRKIPIPEKFWPDLSKPYEELYPLRLPLEDESAPAAQDTKN